MNIIEAVIARRSDVVSNLLQNGVDPNYCIADGISVLHFAAQNNDLTAAKILLKYGANPNNKNMDQQTPLDIAMLHGHTEMVHFLFENIEKHKVK